MNLLQLKYFRTTAELLHMTKAAKKLYISQPSLSQSIKSLENELGVSLFDRNGRNLVLNKNGEILLKHAITALDAIDNAITEINEESLSHFCLSLSICAASSMIPQIVTGFQTLHPDVELYINQTPLNSNDNTSDLYLFSSDKPLHGINQSTLLQEQCFIGMSKDNPLAKNNVISPEMLRNEHFLTMQNHLPLYKITYNLCQDAGFEPKIFLELETRETIFSLISVGMGIAVIPSKTWAPYISNENIILKPLSVPCMRHIVLQWDENKHFSKSMYFMKDFLADYFRKI